MIEYPFVLGLCLLTSLSWRVISFSLKQLSHYLSLSFEWASKITPHVAIDPIIQVISLIPRLLPLVKVRKEQGTLNEVTLGLCPIVFIWSSICPLGTLL